MYQSLENSVPLTNNTRSTKIKGFSAALFGASMLSVSLLLAYIIIQYGITSFFLIAVGIVALPVIYMIIAYPKAGILLLIVMAYLIMLVGRFGLKFPMGTIMDGIETLLLFSFFLRQKYEQ